MKKLVIFALIAAVAFMAGCTEPIVIDNNNTQNNTIGNVSFMDDSLATEAGVAGVINANNQFAFEFYKEINEDGKNMFFSPYSISSAFSMAYEGAKGNTADEIRNVFHFTEDDAERRSSFARIYNIRNKQNKSYLLSTANAFWGQEQYPFVEAYKSVIDTYYGGEIRNVDFISENEETRLLINSWVENKTYGKIKGLIPEGFLNPLTRLVLTNTVYFKGSWDLQFDKDLTYEGDFATSLGTEKVQMMKINNVKTQEHDKTEFNYYEDDEVQVIELPYKDKELSMLVILPKESIEAIEEKMTAEQVSEWKDSMHESDVREIHLPKFKFETKYFLKNNLINMGMIDAFDPGAADFTGMENNPDGDLCISSVIHQTFVEVNEEGTEAAAATAIAIAIGVDAISVPELIIFKADHPFIFMIQEHETGDILFMGKMENPNQA